MARTVLFVALLFALGAFVLASGPLLPIVELASWQGNADQTWNDTDGEQGISGYTYYGFEVHFNAQGNMRCDYLTSDGNTFTQLVRATHGDEAWLYFNGTGTSVTGNSLYGSSGQHSGTYGTGASLSGSYGNGVGTGATSHHNGIVANARNNVEGELPPVAQHCLKNSSLPLHTADQHFTAALAFVTAFGSQAKMHENATFTVNGASLDCVHFHIGDIGQKADFYVYMPGGNETSVPCQLTHNKPGSWFHSITWSTYELGADDSVFLRPLSCKS